MAYTQSRIRTEDLLCVGQTRLAATLTGLVFGPAALTDSSEDNAARTFLLIYPVCDAVAFWTYMVWIVFLVGVLPFR